MAFRTKLINRAYVSLLAFPNKVCRQKEEPEAGEDLGHQMLTIGDCELRSLRMTNIWTESNAYDPTVHKHKRASNTRCVFKTYLFLERRPSHNDMD